MHQKEYLCLYIGGSIYIKFAWYYGTYIRRLLKIRCARKEEFLLIDLFKAFD